MAEHGANSNEDTEIADCDGEKVVTMMDVLQEQQDFEDDANAVLGASDDKNCTYLKGYVKRQAIYACLTCCPDAKHDETKRAGVCLACSLNCHENHDLVELYTKRNFLCDCGNPKFNSHPCQFTSNKVDLNDSNNYNQNFAGIYCICHRPYPDPEALEEDEMIQCIICEDWLHSAHLGSVVPPADQYAEMVCKDCMEKNEFLHDYSDIAVITDNFDVDIVSINPEPSIISVTTITNDDKELFNGSKDIEQNGPTTDVEMSNDNLELSDEKVLRDIEAVLENNSSEEQNTFNDTKSSVLIETSLENTAVENIEKHSMNSDSSKNDEDASKNQEDSSMNEEDSSKNVEDPSKNEDSSKSQEDSLNNEEDSSKYVEDFSKNKEDSKNIEENKVDMEISNINDQNYSEHSSNTPKDIELHENVIKEIVDSTNFEPETQQNNETKINAIDNMSSPKKENSLEGTVVSNTDSLPETHIETSEEIYKTTESTDMDIAVQADETEKLDKINFETSKELNNLTETNNVAPPGVTHQVENLENNLEANEELIKTNEPDDKQVQKELDEIERGDNTNGNENSEANVKICEDLSHELDIPASEQINISVALEVPHDALQNQTNKNLQEKEADETNLDVTENPTDQLSINKDETSSNIDSIVENGSISNGNDEYDLKRKLDDKVESEAKKLKLDNLSSRREGCSRPIKAKKILKGSTFWPINFRQKLCTCSECISMYKDLSVLFLTDPEDSVTAYELLGQEKTPPSQYERGLEALSSLDRVQQINALTEYNKMRDKLLDFLKSFKDRKEIVKEDDIKAFFAGMKPKREPDGVYFCR